jgi:hypothetical protein
MTDYNLMENEDSNIALSSKLLLSVKMKNDTAALELQLKNNSMQQLTNELVSDDAKKCFWINIYNSFYQIIVNRSNGNATGIYKRKEIIIGQSTFSLDEIEHGILRRSRLKWSLGYLANPFASKLIKSLAVEQVDYRIHFALNCGAKSCPPIAFYNLQDLEEQLSDAMHSFILSETIIDQNNKIITSSKILFWYIGDFGGTKAIQKIISKVFEIDLGSYKIKYYSYNWDSALDNFKE